MRFASFCMTTVFLFSGCQSRKIDNSMIVDPDDPVSYAQDIQPIFNTNCAGSGCHIDGTTNGVRLSSYDRVITSRGFQYNRLIVEPFAPSESPLVDKINANPDFGVRMPADKGPLTAEQISLITTWIEEGAEDN